jgi:hypothetical protein
MGDIFLKYIKVFVFCIVALLITGILAFGMYMTRSLLVTVQIAIAFFTLPCIVIFIYLTVTTIIEKVKRK